MKSESQAMLVDDKNTLARDLKIQKKVGEDTRQRILDAARKVFAVQSFKSASTRMIAREAGVEHPLIHYYFGSKDKLFEEICREIYEEFGKLYLSWMEQTSGRVPRVGFPMFVDLVVDYTFSNPDPIQLIFQNIVQLGSAEGLPGSKYLLKHLEEVRGIMKEKVPIKSSEAELNSFIHCMMNFVIYYLGAKSSHAKILNLDPNGDDYRQWVRNIMISVFLPWIEKIIFGEKNN